jgi:uncharacterized protein YgbK (DUF1537 family)
MLIGCVADDFTGATDVAAAFARAGLRAVQVNGVPGAGLQVAGAAAVVVALKSRTAPLAEAVAQSRAAARWLREHGARHLVFKVCSTFDSTPAGNIGPVADALLDLLDAPAATPPLNLVSPAYPRNGRNVYRGYLFVGDLLLSETGMRTHPLTPMTDANLVRVLAAQTARPVGLLRADEVARGAGAIGERLRQLAAAGVRHVVADAIDDAHLTALGAAVTPAMLVTAGAGLAEGLARALAPPGAAAALAPVRRDGPAVILSGSCSTATLAQLEAVRECWPVLRLDPLQLARDADVAPIVAEATRQLARGPVVIAASAAPETVAAAQDALGRAHAAELVEQAFRRIAPALAAAGVTRFVVAGGETSGAVVEALDVRALAIGPEIAPGVPWTQAADDKPYALALKSGNFGGPDFFQRALAAA